MKRKFVMAAAAVAMAAVVGVSAFAAEGATVPSITGDALTGTSFTAPSSEEASKETKETYETIVNTEGGVEEKLSAIVGEKKAEEAIAKAGVASDDELSIRAIGEVTTTAKDGEVTMNVAGLTEGEKVVVMYVDENGQWQSMTVTAKAGKLVFKLPKAGTVILLTKKNV